jgi:hypothetical protein
MTTAAAVPRGRLGGATPLHLAMLLFGAATGALLPRTAVPATALALALAVGLRSWHKP